MLATSLVNDAFIILKYHFQIIKNKQYTQQKIMPFGHKSMVLITEEECLLPVVGVLFFSFRLFSTIKCTLVLEA
jgi:hypothetical protein